MSSSNQRPANRGFRAVLRCAISHYRQSSCLSVPEPGTGSVAGLGGRTLGGDSRCLFRGTICLARREAHRLTVHVESGSWLPISSPGRHANSFEFLQSNASRLGILHLLKSPTGRTCENFRTAASEESRSPPNRAGA